MADEFIPELTLNPNSPLAGQGQAAAAPAPAAASTPPSEAHLPESDLDEAKLSPAQRKAVEDFARTIDITDSNVVLQYGAAAQKNVSEFSENTLQQIRTKDLGQIGETLADLVRQLQEFDPEEEKKGFAGFFRRKKNQLAALKAGYLSLIHIWSPGSAARRLWPISCPRLPPSAAIFRNVTPPAGWKWTAAWTR